MKSSRTRVIPLTGETQNLSKKSHFDVAIIGGMGPLAGAELLRRITLYTKAESDRDHIGVALLSLPSVPDRSEYILSQDSGEKTVPSPFKSIKKQIRMAKKLHCRYLCIACNTAHFLANDIEKTCKNGRHKLTFINMVRETVSYTLSAHPEGRICVLASDGTVAADIYGSFAPKGTKILYPSKVTQGKITEIIKSIKASAFPSQGETDALEEALGGEFDTDKTVFILGCTELSLIAPLLGKITYVDSTDVLAGKIISLCKKEVNKGYFKLNGEA